MLLLKGILVESSNQKKKVILKSLGILSFGKYKKINSK